MDRRTHFFPIARPFLVVLVALLVGLVVLVQLGTFQYAYQRLGVAPAGALVILALELAGSYINLPIAWLRSEAIIDVRRVAIFGVVYIVPEVVRPRQTLVAVNVGGAVIPTLLSIYLLIHAAVWTAALATTIVVIIGVKLVARPVPGLGIAVPTFLPAALTALAATLIATPAHAPPVAFASGTLGTLIGGDLLNLPRIASLRAPIVSIGGAGTFDSVFVTGIVAVVLVTISR